MLNTRALHKEFGGVTATDRVDLQVTSGELHALIGPNGAGKTTLISMLSGMLKPDSGSIFFDNRDITGLPAHVLPGLGLARSFQITSVFTELCVLDNIALAIQAAAGHSFRFWTNARKDKTLRQPARQYADRVGLLPRCDDTVSNLSHGERRQLEIAMALATQPRMLLLDEPMAGMGPEESREMGELLKTLKGDKTILMVEHDMDTVFSLADRISVLVYGKIIATGSTEEIRANPDVQRAYLGTAADA